MNLNFAENLKRLRKAKGLTQEKVADALDVSAQSVSRWELSICYPDLELLPSIANFFGVTVDDLLSNDSGSKERDAQIFRDTVFKLSSETTERIRFVQEYCGKYPENDEYAYQLVRAIRDHVISDEKKTEKYMALLLKNVERLNETRYRDAVIRDMVAVCAESELEHWLDMTPYAGFSRRRCLVSRASERDEDEALYVQHGLEMLEIMAYQLDRRCPDTAGPEKKMEYQKQVLRVIDSFGKNGEIPDGWKLFYAYKQLVLSACLFGQSKEDEGWAHFDAALEKCKAAFAKRGEWLDLGGALFSCLKVSADWSYAMDENGNKHKLFGIVNMSFHNYRWLLDLLVNPRWAWFNSVRETERFQAALAWMQEARSAFEKK